MFTILLILAALVVVSVRARLSLRIRAAKELSNNA